MVRQYLALGGFITLTLLLIYMFVIRPVLVHQPVLADAFKAEASWLDQLRAKLYGWKTRIAGRLTILAGILVELYNNAMPLIAGQDWTPITKDLPPWVMPVTTTLIGIMFLYLNKITKEPGSIPATIKTDEGQVKVVGLMKPMDPMATPVQQE